MCRLLSVDCADFLPVDCADILLLDCAHFWHVTRFARCGRFAPAGLASRARDHAVHILGCSRKAQQKELLFLGFHKNGSISTPRASPELSKTHTDTANRAESFYQGPGPRSAPQNLEKSESKLREQPSCASVIESRFGCG